MSGSILIFFLFALISWAEAVDTISDSKSNSQLTAPTFDSDRPRLLWAPGEIATVNLHFSNQGKTAYIAPCSVSLTDDLEKPIWTKTLTLQVPAQGKGSASLPVDTAGLRQGVYFLKWQTPDGALKAQALLTIASLPPLPKAKGDEFLYGIDMAGLYSDTTRLDWCDWCGVDIVRFFGRDVIGKTEDLEDIGKAVETLRQRNMTGLMMYPALIPFDKDPAKFDQIIAQKAHFIGGVAKRFKGVIKWYELGNEPDQYFFFHGGGASYVKIYEAMYDAVKAEDPVAIVSNGGLCFHDNYGEQVAHEIIKDTPADKIDAWAYHAHGPGSAAEQNVYNQLVEATSAAGNGKGKPIFSTESGFAANNPTELRIQARTVVQKMIFAESTGRVRMFLWFGFHPNWGFGLLETPNQARPGALAYRVMVEHTRGLKEQGALDLFGAPGEAYLLSNPDGRATVVLWSDGVEFTRDIQVGTGARDVMLYDLFGNASQVKVDARGCVQVNIGADPVYLCARLAPGVALTIPEPAIKVQPVLTVAPRTTISLKAVLHNVSASALTVQLTVTPRGSIPVEATAQQVTLPPGQAILVSIPLKITEAAPDWWPASWRVFAPIGTPVDLSTITTLPQTLASSGQALPPRTATLVNGSIDLKALTGGSAEKREAICFAEVDSPEDREVEIGTAADFWMDWWINGREVFNVLKDGNGPSQTMLTHTFKAQLKKGKNLIAVRVLSGQGGWCLLSGGTESVAAARRQRSGISDGTVLELHQGDQILARELVRIVVAPSFAVDGDGNMISRPADAVLGQVNNFHVKNPDSTLWYKGPYDLSGQVWLGEGKDGSLHVTALIHDDIDKPGDDLEIDLAWGDDQLKSLHLTKASADVKVQRDEAAKTTRYDATIPRASLPVEPRGLVAVRIVAHDDDWGVPKQEASTAVGDSSADWPQFWFNDK